jgi:hypothetical protein
MKRRRGTELRWNVLANINEMGPSTETVIARRCALTTARPHLLELVTRGYVSREQGIYRLTDFGRGQIYGQHPIDSDWR